MIRIIEQSRIAQTLLGRALALIACSATLEGAVRMVASRSASRTGSAGRNPMPPAGITDLPIKECPSAARHCVARFTRALVILGGSVTPLIAQTAQAASPVTWAPFDLPRLQQTILRSAAGAPYRIVVTTPAGPAPAAGYPVIYVLDGNAWTSLVSEIIRINVGLGTQSRVEPAVVVGIGYPIDSAFDIARRDLDLTSPVPPDYVPPGGNKDTGHLGGDIALMDFIDKVVKPVIEARFPIDRSRQTLLGHSLGGLFTMNTMLDRPGSFQTYVAMSPSVYWNHRALLRNVEQFVAKGSRPKKLRVFLSVGDAEQFRSAAYLDHARAVFGFESKTDAEAETQLRDVVSFYGKVEMVGNARRLAALLIKGHIPTTFIEFRDEDHFSVVPAALGRAVPFALSDDLPAR